MATEAEAPSDVILQRRLRAYELALDSARRDAVDAAQTLSRLTARVAELELALSAAREAPASLEARLAEQTRARRGAEQRAYAERAYREELQQELAAIESGRERAEDSLAQLSTAAARRRELEDEVVRLCRRADEAEHVAAASRSARERAEHGLAEVHQALAEARSASGPGRSIGAPLAAEFALIRARAVRAPSAVSAARAPVSVERPAVADATARGKALEDELVHRRRSAAAPAPAVPDGALATARVTAPSGSRLAAVLRELRAELRGLARLVEHERAARRAAEAGAESLAGRVQRPIGRSGAAPRVSGPAPRAGPAPLAGPSASGGAGPVEPQRFAPALARLREITDAVIEEAAEPTPAPATPAASAASVASVASVAPELAPVAPEPPGVLTEPAGPWLRSAFSRLAGRDPRAAGELVLALLPAQGLAHPRPIAYDLVLDEPGCLRITVESDGRTTLAEGGPRPADEVRFAVVGDPASLGRLLAAGWLRRRFGRGLARVDGDRGGLAALDALTSRRLSLGRLRAAGVRLAPGPALRLAAAMIEPAWTAGSAFTVAHRDPGAPAGVTTGIGLVIDDGRSVLAAPAGETPTVTVVCSPEQLLAVLDGADPDGFALEGPREPLVRLRRWIKRAQSG